MRGKRIVLAPLLRDEADLQDAMARMAWAIGLASFQDLVAFVATPELAAIEWRVPESMDPTIAPIQLALRPRVTLVAAATAREFLARVAEADIVVERREDELFDGVSADEWAHALRGKRVFKADPARTRQEFGNLIELNSQLRADREAEVEQCRRSFHQVLAAVGRAETAYCLATGPSLAAFRETNFDGAISIVCNSAILDEELMEWVRPKFLVFADPIFHFGPSLYAAAFRTKLRESCARHDYAIIVPMKFYGLLTDAMPDLRARVIGIPSDKPNGFNLDLAAEYRVFTTANILTYLMLPVASTIARKIYMLGCDGRPLNQDTYFWQHNKRTQINDQMDNIKVVHPGFFAIDYNDYYLDHCRQLAELIADGERMGREYGAVTPSFIPCLERRPANLPRTLIIDFTELGARNATGQLKATLFKRWSADRILQVRPLSSRDGSFFRLHTLVEHPELRAEKFDRTAVLRECLDFAPEMIYFRPTESPPEFFELGMELVERLRVPVITHIMDDWPERLRENDPAMFARIDPGLRRLITASAVCLGISDAMDAAYRERYGREFVPVANGIEPEEWPAPSLSRAPDDSLVIRYCGGMTEDMTLASVETFARVVSSLQSEAAIRFEIYALPAALKTAQAKFRNLPGVKVLPSVEWRDYPHLLATAGAVLIAYNFDDRTRTYTRYSMANKLPECLASGAPLVVFGPDSIATVRRARELGAAVTITAPDENALRSALLDLHRTPAPHRERALAAREYARRELTAEAARQVFQTHVTTFKRAPMHEGNTLLGPYNRLQRMSVNDCEVAAQFFARTACARVAIVLGDVAERLVRQFMARGWDVLRAADPAALRSLPPDYPRDTRAVVIATAAAAPDFSDLPLPVVAALIYAEAGDPAPAFSQFPGAEVQFLWSARYPRLAEQWPPDYRALRCLPEAPAGVAPGPGAWIAFDAAVVETPPSVASAVLYLRKAYYACLSGGGKQAQTFARNDREVVVRPFSREHFASLLRAVLASNLRARLAGLWRDSCRVKHAATGRVIHLG